MTWVTVFALTLLIIVIAVLGMAIGVMLGRKRLSGSCGGLANFTAKDGSTSCMLCSVPADSCKRRALQKIEESIDERLP